MSADYLLPDGVIVSGLNLTIQIAYCYSYVFVSLRLPDTCSMCEQTSGRGSTIVVFLLLIPFPSSVSLTQSLPPELPQQDRGQWC